MTLEHPPAVIEGALEAAQAAAEKFPIGVISDTGVATGKTIQALLGDAGFTDIFSSYTFSDETGVSKPQASMYHNAAAKLNVDVTGILHIGDLEPTDIAGALGVGARAALFAGDNDRFIDNTKAHHTFRGWTDFVQLLPELA